MIEFPFYTEKQNVIYNDINTLDDWSILLLHGAVRTGKTKFNNDVFLDELIRVRRIADKKRVRLPKYILASTSSSTLQTNVLDELSNDYGLEFKFDKHNNFILNGVKVVTTFTNSVRGIGAIRGMESYGAYINELTLAKKEVYDEINKRNSGYGARLIADTNPDAPSHYVKKDIIDIADGKNILQYHFKLDDNTFLNERYIRNLKQSTPSGAFYDRGILGLWTAGEGAIYQDFNKDTQIVSEIPYRDIERYFVGVDWGWEHTGVMLVVGVTGDRYYVVEEHAHKYWHIDTWIDKAKEIASKYHAHIPFSADSARPEYVDALYYAGLNASNANKAVIPGITEVATIMKQDKLFVHESCEVFLEEVDQYAWNDTGDKPIKEHDDAQDALRYAIYTDKMNY